jgi:hypothetical protein
VIETVEPCATCSEVTPHSRRRHAPLAWLAATLGLLASLQGAAAITAARLGAGLLCIALASCALGLLKADRARRWDLACTRCRGKALAAARPLRRRWRLPLRATTIDLG